MKSFQKSAIKLSQETITDANQFAAAVVSTVNYGDSNQENKVKIQNDHFVSKLGEEAVKSVFEQLNCKVVGPDYIIYQGKKKSWADDLTVDGEGLAVKTMRRTSGDRYGLSWTFQSSPERRDPILDHPEAWVCFVEFIDKDSCDELIVYPPKQIKELQFSEPYLPHLKGKKKVVYVSTLENM
jgi:hypothetical protein